MGERKTEENNKRLGQIDCYLCTFSVFPSVVGPPSLHPRVIGLSAEKFLPVFEVGHVSSLNKGMSRLSER